MACPFEKCPRRPDASVCSDVYKHTASRGRRVVAVRASLCVGGGGGGGGVLPMKRKVMGTHMDYVRLVVVTGSSWMILQFDNYRRVT